MSGDFLRVFIQFYLNFVILVIFEELQLGFYLESLSSNVTI